MLRRKKPWRAEVAAEHLCLGQACVVPWGRVLPDPALTPNLPHLAALTGMHAIVEARGNVPTHFAQQHHAVELCGKRGAGSEREGGLRGRTGRFSGLGSAGEMLRKISSV